MKDEVEFANVLETFVQSFDEDLNLKEKPRDMLKEFSDGGTDGRAYASDTEVCGSNPSICIVVIVI